MPPKPSTSAQVLVEETKKVLKEKNVVKFHQIITKLKKKCSTKAAVLEFFQENLSCYHVLLNAMDILMSGGWKLNDSPLGTVMCKELISLIANLCHFTVTAAVELRKLNGTNFSSNSLRLLESALGFRNDSILKASLLRLLSNLADYRETCSLVTLHSSLLDKIAYMLNDTEKIIYEASIRVIKQLSRHRSCVKHVVMSNSAYYMGVRIKQLPQGDIIDDVNILSTMELLSKSTYIRDFGRQLAQSTCNEALMNILYSEIKEDKDDLLKRWKSLIVFLAKYSFQMREMFNQRVIEEVVQKGVLDKYLCSFLISFTVEPYGRSALRLGGGIDLILERMTSIKSLKEQSEIVASFKNFIHHSPGLSWICHKSQLMELCLKLMEEVLQDNVVEHKIEGEAEDQLEAAVRGEYDSRLYPYETSARKPPLPSTYRNSSYSPPQNYSPANSPLYPTSPMSMSSLSPLSSPPSSSRDHSPSPASYFGYASNDESPSTKEPEDKRITIINDCMWLYRFISHDDTQLDCLIQPNVLRGFIRYLGKSPSINDKLAHTLKCVARVRLHIANLLEIRFPYLLVFELIRRPCLSTRFARICSECAEKSRYGFEILNDFVNEVDSSFGMGVLNMQISSMEQKTHLYGLLNGLLLLKSSERRSRFSERVKPLEGIFEYLKQCLENETEVRYRVKNDLGVRKFPKSHENAVENFCDLNSRQIWHCVLEVRQDEKRT
uniref:BTB domain-containing protein n=1 Tax=Bursaphelenchus xylophilus TaxID=6326 RepID=A0A1I7S1Y8_BURXY